MEERNFIEKLASQFGQNASVKNVFGEPIQAGDKTIIPVARVAYVLGGGYGQGGKKNKPVGNSPAPIENEKKAYSGEGAGGGGGLYAKPNGVYEITSSATRFIPPNSNTQLLIGVAVGFLIRGWLIRRHKRIK